MAIVGVGGYTGGELLRLLRVHPAITVVGVAGRSSVGRRVSEVHPHLDGEPDLEILPVDRMPAADVVVLALPRGEAAALAPSFLEGGARVIDLSGDFRLSADDYPTWYGFAHPAPAWLDKAVYGLPELFRETIAAAELVANPGCFPTPAVLGLAPVLAAGMIEPGAIAVDGKTGISGAGRDAADASMYAASEESVRPYRFPRHQHTPEIERALTATCGVDAKVSFVPHLVPAVRGVLVTCYARAAAGASTRALTECLLSAYEGAPFVRVLPPGSMADTKRVRGSNVLELHAAVDERTSTAVIVGAIDNLVKGAAGQAIQNLNLMLGIEETTGLPRTGIYP